MWATTNKHLNGNRIRNMALLISISVFAFFIHLICRVHIVRGWPKYCIAISLYYVMKVFLDDLCWKKIISHTWDLYIIMKQIAAQSPCCDGSSHLGRNSASMSVLWGIWTVNLIVTILSLKKKVILQAGKLCNHHQNEQFTKSMLYLTKPSLIIVSQILSNFLIFFDHVQRYFSWPKFWSLIDLIILGVSNVMICSKIMVILQIVFSYHVVSLIHGCLFFLFQWED